MRAKFINQAWMKRIFQVRSGRPRGRAQGCVQTRAGRPRGPDDSILTWAGFAGQDQIPPRGLAAPTAGASEPLRTASAASTPNM